MSEKLDIKPGDLLRVSNIKGPIMIADGHVSGKDAEALGLVTCYWFSDDNLYQRAQFREVHLEKAN